MKNNIWQLQQAKAKLSDLIRRVLQNGPQHITVHGKSGVVVLSEIQYQHLTQSKYTFVNFIRNSPFFDLDLDLKRNKSQCREINL